MSSSATLDHGLGPPTEVDALLALQRHYGRERAEALWASACRSVGVRRWGGPLLIDDLEPIADYLASQDGMQRLVGGTLRIRLRTYRLLRARQAVPGAAR